MMPFAGLRRRLARWLYPEPPVVIKPPPRIQDYPGAITQYLAAAKLHELGEIKPGHPRWNEYIPPPAREALPIDFDEVMKLRSSGGDVEDAVHYRLPEHARYALGPMAERMANRWAHATDPRNGHGGSPGSSDES